ncbi:MAG: hypothetical protein NTY61_01220 [Candidatus Parcubacteria bacterium]|nr:hypothetical protein [Candidatus Parcubacteria bacterium]
MKWSVLLLVACLIGCVKITQQPISQEVNTGTDVEFRIGVENADTIGWRKDGVDIPGASGETLSLSTVTANDAGEYQAFVQNSVGKVNSDMAVLTVIITTNLLNYPIMGVFENADKVKIDSQVVYTDRYNRIFYIAALQPGINKFVLQGQNFAENDVGNPITYNINCDQSLSTAGDELLYMLNQDLSATLLVNLTKSMSMILVLFPISRINSMAPTMWRSVRTV